MDSPTWAAAPPYPPRSRTPGTELGQFLQLVGVMLKEYRTVGFWHVFGGVLMPLGMLFFITAAGPLLTPERAVFLVGGNLSVSMTFGPANMLANRIGWGRHNKQFDYWSALPISKLAFVLAIMTVSLIFALPGALLVFLLGGLMLDLPLGGAAGLLLLLPLAALSLAGLGAFLGAYAKDGPTANLFSNLLIAVVTFMSPTMIPFEALPLPLQWSSWISPITYSADALRKVLAGEWGAPLLTDAAVLAAFSAAFLYLVQRKLDWRGS